MSSNEKTIKCENCRQEISANKMFLHEGFCKRNNVFCEHCEKVYLKKDYDEHILAISKKNSKGNVKESKIINIKSEKNKKETIKDKTSLEKKSLVFREKQIEYIEQYKINNPIIISPFGEILSQKNKNEYLLPILGIDQEKNNDYLINGTYLNQEEKLKINNNILKYANLNYNNNETKVKKIYRVNNMNNQNNFNQNEYKLKNNIINQNNNLNKQNLRIKEETVNNKNNTKKNNLVIKEIKMNDKDNLILKNKSIDLINIKHKNANLNDDNILKKNNQNSEIDKENILNNRNGIIINSNIITYNDNNINKVNKVNNSIKKISHPQNINKTPNKITSNYQVKTQFNPVRRQKKNDIKKFRKKNIETNIINSFENSEIFYKEPLDNMQKKSLKLQVKKENKTVILTNKKYNNIIDKKNNNKPISIRIDLSNLNFRLDKDKKDDLSYDGNNNRALIKQINPTMNITNNEKRNYRDKFRGKSEDKFDNKNKKKLYKTTTNDCNKLKNSNKLNLDSPKDNIRANKSNINFEPKNANKYEKNNKIRYKNKIIRKSFEPKYKPSTQEINDNSSNNIFDPLFFFEQRTTNIKNENKNNINMIGNN